MKYEEGGAPGPGQGTVVEAKAAGRGGRARGQRGLQGRACSECRPGQDGWSGTMAGLWLAWQQ